MPPVAQTLTEEGLAAVRMAAQGLGGAHRSVDDAVRGCAGVQAQDLAAARLAVRSRTSGLRLDDVGRAWDEDRSVVRTWAMRGTLHAVPVADVRWLVALLGPGVVAGYHRRRESLGLTGAVCNALLDRVPEVLSGGPLTRSEMVAALNDRGVGIAPKGQAGAHAVLFAAASGVLCRGPDRGNEPTYVLVDDWVGKRAGPPRPGQDAETLAHRYLDAFGPADAKDFLSWSGLRAAEGRAALDAVATGSVIVGSRTLLTTTLPPPEDGWRLLPAFDTALLGYRDRADLGSSEALDLVFAGGGWIHPAVVHAGRVVGSWRWRGKGADPSVAVQLTARPMPAARQALTDEAADVGRFLGISETRLELVESLS